MAYYEDLISCVFCGSHKTKLGFCYDINQDDVKSIRVVEQESDINIIRENLIYNVICKECGSIFDVPLRAIS